ncbi:MAG: hypothetical protein ACOYLB_02285 [Phototrophicaceae bacterium]
MTINFAIRYTHKRAFYYDTLWEGKITSEEFQRFILEISEHWGNNQHCKKAKRSVMIVDASQMVGLPPMDFKTFRSLVSMPVVRTDLVYVNAPNSWKVLGNFITPAFKISVIFCDSKTEAIKHAEKLANYSHCGTNVCLN